MGNQRLIDVGDTPTICFTLSQVLETPGSWCNLERTLFEEPIDESPLFGLLAARGPANPLATVMGPSGRHGSKPAQLGIQHRAGQKALSGLAENGLALPEQWQVKQDHPRRGIVVIPSPEADVESVWMWLNASMEALARAPISELLVLEEYGV